MNNNDSSEIRDTLFVAGGAALMILGAGLVMAHPAVRRVVMGSLRPLLPEIEEPLKAGVARVLPDVERYLKIRAM